MGTINNVGGGLPENDKHEYAEKRGRNQEYYRDPTYHEAKKRTERYFRKKTIPAYIRTKSKRYEVVGMIMRICDLAGFELAERVKLRDKVTGEVLD